MWAEVRRERWRAEHGTTCNACSAPPMARTYRQCVACRDEVGLKLILLHNNSLEFIEMSAAQKKKSLDRIFLFLFSKDRCDPRECFRGGHTGEELHPLAMPSG